MTVGHSIAVLVDLKIGSRCKAEEFTDWCNDISRLHSHRTTYLVSICAAYRRRFCATAGQHKVKGKQLSRT